MDRASVAPGDLQGQLEFERVITEVSARVFSVSDQSFAATIEDALGNVVRFFGADRGGVLAVSGDGRSAHVLHGWYSDDLTDRVSGEINLVELFPYAAKLLIEQARPFVVERYDDMPPEAARDRASHAAMGVRSTLNVPVRVEGSVRYIMTVDAMRAEVRWPPSYLPRNQVLGEIIASAIERRRINLALRESEARLTLAAQSAGAGPWDLDVATGRIWATPEAKVLYGFAPGAEVTLDAVLASIHPGDADRVRGRLAAVTEHGGEFTDEYRVVLPGGGARWIAARGRAHVAPGGPTRMLGVSLDITARKHAEAERSALDAQRQAAADAAGLGFYRMTDGGATVVLDDRCRALLGIPPDQEQRTRAFWLEHVHPADYDRVREVSARTVSGQVESESIDYRYRHPERGVIWLNHFVRASEHTPQGRVASSVGVLQDITARKDAETALVTALADVQRLRDQLERENVYLRQETIRSRSLGSVVAQSQAMRRVMTEIERVAATDSTVLLLGETGSGKELLASAIHNLSHRRNRAMVRVNCAAIPATLIEAELFGREKGAYTGALSKQVGRFELASGSTIFLDEIGDLPLDIQVKLLRVLQERQIERLGSPRPVDVDLRIIAATNRDLGREVREGRFREDLFYRINVFPVSVPPLRERPEDLPLLVDALVQELAGRVGKHVESVSRASLEAIQRYHWPGNVRELRNVIERAMILAPGPVLEIAPPPAGGASVDASPVGARPAAGAAGLTREALLQVLENCGWRIRGRGGAAERLGLKPTTVEYRMAKLGIKRP